MTASGQLEKLEIYSYKNAKDMGTGKNSGTFTVQLNPQEFKRTMGIQYHREENLGNYASAKQMDFVRPQLLSFSFMLDGTGLFSTVDKVPLSGLSYDQKGRDEDYVNKKLKELRQLTIDYDGVQHQSPYVAINWWGDDKLFKGIVNDLEITYQLFTAQGKPLRATVSIAVEEHIPIETQARENQESSPDLTHTREVKEGDNLMLLTRDIYGDPRHYREVARVNGLVNFRKLKTGTNLIFPPISKLEQ